MKKRFLSIITALALCLSLLPTVALAAEGDVSYLYCDENGANWQTGTKKAGEYTEITQDYTNWGLTTGWYVVNSNVTFGGNPAVKGDVHLILADNCSLSLGCLYVPSGNSLTIYAQSTDEDTMGRLVAQNESESVGIGGHEHGGTITINGGIVTATGNNGAGIGGGGAYAGNGGIVTINGGIVTATSTNGAGIGGGGRPGSSGDGGVITINGGTVIATSTYGAGIGGGNHGDVTASSGTSDVVSYSAGIGGGCGNENPKAGSGADVTITGGTVTASTTNPYIAAIGWGEGDGGSYRTPGTLIITGGDITPPAKYYGYDDIAGIKPEGDSNLVAFGNLTLPVDLTIPADKTLTIPSGTSLTIPEGKTLIIPEGVTLTNNGTLINNGTIINFGTINGTVNGNTPKTVAAKYLDENGKEQTAFCDAAITADNIDTYGTLNAGWYVVQGTVTATSRITVTGNVHLILEDGCTLTVQNGIEGNGNLTVYAQSTGDAQGSMSAVGCLIEDNDDKYSYGIYVNGNITINGGKITATGSDAETLSCGILAGRELTITGGSVTATGGDAGTVSYGILAGNIIISGGSVEAKGSDAMMSYGICTQGGDGGLGDMTITGGSVTATGGNGETKSCGIFTDSDLTIRGGTVTATGGTATATGSDAETMSCGIFTDGYLTISGGTVTATGNDAQFSYGIYTDNNLTIDGGHVTAQTLAETATTMTALNKEPILNGYAGYYWRTDAAESFTACIDEDTAYQYKSIHTYVEISNGLTYTITLDPNYEGGESSTVLTGTDGTLTTEDLPILTRTGYTFAGWFTATTGGTEVTADTAFTKDTTIYAHWTAKSSGGGSGGVSTYAITVESAKNGTVTMTPKTASKGTTVTLTVVPDKGYTLETLTVTDKNGNEIELTSKGGGKYTFKMPGSKVTVTATFMEDNSMLNFFVDVPADAYYYDAVLWAAANGITGGVDDTHFAPNAPCTRAQIVTFLWRAAGSPVVNYAMDFSDVPADAYYAEAVRWAVSQGITTGTGDGTTFSPNATCTRAQAMTFIYRSEQAQGGGMQGEWMFLNPFDDVNLESYYGEAVMWAVANGVTSGTTDTTFSPNANCTRAQIVTFLYRFFVK